jgi:hypothetical protein
VSYLDFSLSAVFVKTQVVNGVKVRCFWCREKITVFADINCDFGGCHLLAPHMPNTGFWDRRSDLSHTKP